MKEKNHVIRLLEKASNDAHFLERLEFFNKYNNKILQRWENLLQLELLYFLNNNGTKDLWFEDVYNHDKRKWLPTNKDGALSARIDLVYQRPHSRHQGLYTAIELKVNECPISSIRGSLIDLARIRALLKRQWCFNAVFAISIYRKQRSSKYLKLVETNGEVIDFGPYKAAILGWEASTKEEATLSNYELWLKELLGNKRIYSHLPPIGPILQDEAGSLTAGRTP